LPQRQEAAKDAAFIFKLAADMGGMKRIRPSACCRFLSHAHALGCKGGGDQAVLLLLFRTRLQSRKQTNPNVTALKEEDAYPALAEDGYGWEKLFSECMARDFREDNRLQIRMARYHNVYDWRL
jgi:GDP-D-mannose 3',5'-epimerase